MHNECGQEVEYIVPIILELDTEKYYFLFKKDEKISYLNLLSLSIDQMGNKQFSYVEEELCNKIVEAFRKFMLKKYLLTLH